MRKGKSILGLKIISQMDGADLGSVKDLIFDHNSDELVALMVSGKDLFGLIDAKIINWNQVRTIGPDAVMVAGADSVMNAHDDARVAAIIDRESKLSGTRIYTTEGQDIGTLADMYIDETNGRVLGYEVSGGFVSDTMSGKRYMNAPDDIQFGQNVALVPAAVGAELEAQAQSEPGGLKGAASTVKDKATDVYGNIATASIEKQKQFVVGKVASRDVIISSDSATMATPEAVPGMTTGSYTATASELADPVTMTGGMSGMSGTGVGMSNMDEPGVADARVSEAGMTGALAPQTTGVGLPTMPMASDMNSQGETVQGEVLVRQGETITQQHADRAESAGILHQLLLAAGGTVAGGAYDAAKEKVAGAGLGEKAEAAAIGKPAAREVTAPDGSTIVAPGMIITQEIMDRAKMQGKEKEVIASAGLGAASEGAQGAAATVSEHASGFMETIKEKFADLTGAAQDKKAEYDAQSEQNKINNALGRPVTRVILDQSDNVILNTGDLITHKAVDHARTAGVLDVLLDSVYTADPEITPEMLRAKEPGQDALPTQATPTGGPITATVSPDQPSQSTPAQGQTS